jgi:hypothetical protein
MTKKTPKAPQLLSSILSFTGPDAATFLQGQSTNDITALSESNGQFGALCNSKGRVITLYYILLKNDVYYMVLPSDLCNKVSKLLKMYVFRSKVQIEDVTQQCNLTCNVVASDVHIPESKEATNILLNDTFSLHIEFKQQANGDKAAEHTHQTSSLALIHAGIPRITHATSELFIPQMLNLDALNGISFTKGCYTGQEIVARLHYKGTVKRRTYLFTGTSSFNAGEELFLEDTESSIGTVINCEKENSDTYVGLAILKVSTYSKKPITLRDNHKLQVALPYTLPE